MCTLKFFCKICKNSDVMRGRCTSLKFENQCYQYNTTKSLSILRVSLIHNNKIISFTSMHLIYSHYTFY